MTSPGTILSQTPRKRAASNMLCERPTAADMAIRSRENSDSSMPGCPWVTPSHIAGTPPATWAVFETWSATLLATAQTTGMSLTFPATACDSLSTQSSAVCMPLVTAFSAVLTPFEMALPTPVAAP